MIVPTSKAAGPWAIAALLFLLALPGQALARGPELLSLAGLPVQSGEYVAAFHIDTMSVDILAVCRLPSGWTLTAGNHGGPGGELGGQATVGAAFVQGARPPEFHSLFLVDIAAAAHPDPKAPPPFSGTVDVGRYGVDAPPATRPMISASYKLRPAARCPG